MALAMGAPSAEAQAAQQGHNLSALAGNLPDAYERRRMGGEGMEMDPLPTAPFRYAVTMHALQMCWNNQPGRPQAVLDVGAGPALVPFYAQQRHIPIIYHATEQSDAVCDAIRDRGEGISAAVWRFDPPPDGEPLSAALERAPDPFLRKYPVVMASHILEHVVDEYAFLDQCWSMVDEEGYLLLVVPRNDAHRLHFRTYDWDALLAVAQHYAGYGTPLVVWEYDYWADLFLAIPKPPPSKTLANATLVAEQAEAAMRQAERDSRENGKA